VILTDQRERIARFVAERLQPGELVDWGGYSTLGLEIGGRLRAGVIYNFFSPPNICMSVAGEGRHWLTPEFLFSAFDYPFGALGLGRVTGFVSSSNLLSQDFAFHLGFCEEGLMRRALPDGSDLIIYGMLRENCRWISDAFTARLAKRFARRGHALVL